MEGIAAQGPRVAHAVGVRKELHDKSVLLMRDGVFMANRLDGRVINARWGSLKLKALAATADSRQRGLMRPLFPVTGHWHQIKLERALFITPTWECTMRKRSTSVRSEGLLALVVMPSQC